MPKITYCIMLMLSFMLWLSDIVIYITSVLSVMATVLMRVIPTIRLSLLQISDLAKKQKTQKQYLDK